MRISTSQIYNNLLSGVQNQMDIQNKGNAKIASGTRFQTPAQAGLDYKLSLDIRHAQSGIQGSLDGIATAESRLAVSQSTLNDMHNILSRAQAIAVQQSNTGLTASERAAAAQEVGRLLDRFTSNANTKWQGQSLFGGTAVDRDAFVDDGLGNITYNGSNQDRMVAVTSTKQVASNVRGDDPAFINSFNALKNLQNSLQTNNVTGIQNAHGALISSGENMVDLNSGVGGSIRNLQDYSASFEDLKMHLDMQLNDHEAADIAAVVAEIQQASIAMQAAYSQIAQLGNLSLTKYL